MTGRKRLIFNVLNNLTLFNIMAIMAMVTQY